ncbi:MAG: hypothetical protein CL681_27970 [Blastopirellula sp.]|nr:hypothetical protein [Blastopirellula sp.]
MHCAVVMLESFSFVGQVPPWVVDWLTPLWLMSLGVLLGLISLGVLWLVCAGLSRIPVIGSLKDDPQRFRIAGLICGFGVFAVTVAFLTTSGGSLLAGEDQGGLSLTQILGLAIPVLLICLGLGFTMVTLVSKRTIDETWLTFHEGPLWGIGILFGLIAIYGILGISLVRDPDQIVLSFTRLGSVGEQDPIELTIPGVDTQRGLNEDPEPTAVAVSFRQEELEAIIFDSNRRLVISGFEDSAALGYREIDVTDDEVVRWDARTTPTNPFPKGEVTEIFVSNFSEEDADLKLTLVTSIQYPEVMTIPLSALFVVVIFVVYFAHRNALPKISAVALSTFKTSVIQPFYIILLIIGLFLIVLFLYLPYNTFGEDIKMLKDAGLTLIKVLAVLSAVWASSTAITDEIEGRTALTVLSKPIRRQSFIIGKFLGINWATMLMFVVLGTALLFVVSYMPFHEAKEGADDMPSWQTVHFETFAIIPGLCLALMATVVLTGLSVALSTRLPMLANLITCFSIYVLGHLTPLLVQSAAVGDQFEVVMFVAQLIATVLPNLEHFDMQAAITSGRSVPMMYLAWSSVYCLVYSLIALLLSLILFEDRDVA